MAQMRPGYTAAEFRDMMGEGQAFSNQALWGETGTIDLSKLVTFRLPVVVLQGRHDCGASASLVAEWSGRVKAPSKKIVWFEDSSHRAHEEEPGKMLLSLVEIVRPPAREAVQR